MRNTSSKKGSTHLLKPSAKQSPITGNNHSDQHGEQLDATDNSDPRHYSRVWQEEIDRLKAELEKDKAEAAKMKEQLFLLEAWKSELKTHVYPSIILSPEAILSLQDVIDDFFSCSELATWKQNMQDLLSGWVGSKLMKEMNSEDRSDMIFGYHMIVKLIDGVSRANDAMRQHEGLPIRS